MWHSTGRKGTGVEKRSATLAPHYKRELAKYDRRFHYTNRGETGPLVTLLQSFGTLDTGGLGGGALG